METTTDLKCFVDNEDFSNINRFIVGLQLVFGSILDEAFLDNLLEDIDVNKWDAFGDTALHILIKSANKFHMDVLADCHILRSKIESITLKLLAKGADINMRSLQAETPVFLAAKIGQVDTLRILLQNKADPDMTTVFGDTPLHYVLKFSDVYKNSAEIIRLLLENGASVHETNGCGQTALELVVSKNDVRDSTLFIELLIWGASLFVKSGDGKYLLDRFIRHSSQLRPAFEEYILALHCAKMDYSVYPTCPFKYDSLNSAKQQIELIKNIKFGSFSLYDVFSTHRDPTFVCNKNVEDAVKYANFTIRYLDYGSLLRAKFANAKKRYNMMVEAHVKLTDKLPNEIVWKILTFLADEDLESLTNAVNA